MDFIEKYVATRLYRHVFCPVTTDDEERDLAIQTRIRSLHWINTHLLDAQINEMDDNVRSLVENAITCKLTGALGGFGRGNVLRLWGIESMVNNRSSSVKKNVCNRL